MEPDEEAPVSEPVSSGAAESPVTDKASAPSPGDPKMCFIGQGDSVSKQKATTLRGMARNRATQLGIKDTDAWQTLLFEALGCGDSEVTDDLYEAAKAKLKDYDFSA